MKPDADTVEWFTTSRGQHPTLPRRSPAAGSADAVELNNTSVFDHNKRWKAVMCQNARIRKARVEGFDDEEENEIYAGYFEKKYNLAMNDTGKHGLNEKRNEHET